MAELHAAANLVLQAPRRAIRTSALPLAAVALVNRPASLPAILWIAQGHRTTTHANATTSAEDPAGAVSSASSRCCLCANLLAMRESQTQSMKSDLAARPKRRPLVSMKPTGSIRKCARSVTMMSVWLVDASKVGKKKTPDARASCFRPDDQTGTAAAGWGGMQLEMRVACSAPGSCGLARACGWGFGV